jgi:L-threonylcarbamoyladenylate synthase
MPLAQQQSLAVEQAAECLRRGEVIAYPTEAVYGLGCDPANEAAVRHILRLKNRSPDAGLILIADTLDRLSPFIQSVNPKLLASALATWPGPVTWLFPRAESVPDWLAGNHATIAVRVSAHPVCRSLCESFVCRSLCEAFGGAIVSTSANPSTAKPAISQGQVEDYFGDAIAGVVQGTLGANQRPSEIRDLATGAVIRAGGT